jgi:hypothetical protein
MSSFSFPAAASQSKGNNKANGSRAFFIATPTASSSRTRLDSGRMPDGERALGKGQCRIRDEFKPSSDRSGSTLRSHGLEGGIPQRNGEQQGGAAVLGSRGNHLSGARAAASFLPIPRRAFTFALRVAVITTAPSAPIPTSSQAMISNRRHVELGSC